MLSAQSVVLCNAVSTVCRLGKLLRELLQEGCCSGWEPCVCLPSPSLMSSRSCSCSKIYHRVKLPCCIFPGLPWAVLLQQLSPDTTCATPPTAGRSAAAAQGRGDGGAASQAAPGGALGTVQLMLDDTPDMCMLTGTCLSSSDCQCARQLLWCISGRSACWGVYCCENVRHSTSAPCFSCL